MKTFERFFEDMPINFFIHDGEVTATAGEVGMCITNANNPRDGSKRVRNIIDRHPNDFADLTSGLKLRSLDGRVRETLCLKSRAIWLVAFFARGKRAEEFRLWASQQVDDLAKNNKVLVDADHYQFLLESKRQSDAQAALAFEAMEGLCDVNKKMTSLAGQLLAARKLQIKSENALRRDLSSYPLFEGEEYNLTPIESADAA